MGNLKGYWNGAASTYYELGGLMFKCGLILHRHHRHTYLSKACSLLLLDNQQVLQQQTTCLACIASRIGPSGSQIRPRWRQALRVDAPPAVKMDVPHSSVGMAPRSEVQSQSPGWALLRESSQPVC